MFHFFIAIQQTTPKLSGLKQQQQQQYFSHESVTWAGLGENSSALPYLVSAWGVLKTKDWKDLKAHSHVWPLMLGCRSGPKMGLSTGTPT